MKKLFALLVLVGSAVAENGTILSEDFKQVDDPVRNMLIIAVVTILVLYIVIRLLLWVYSKSKEKRALETSQQATAQDRLTQLQQEQQKLKAMIEKAKNSYYKRELSQEESNKLIFEYKQRLIETESELSQLTQSPKEQ